jgi:hypothetical protein
MSLVPEARRLVEETLANIRREPASEMLGRVEPHQDDPFVLQPGDRREHLVLQEARKARRLGVDPVLPGAIFPLAPRFDPGGHQHARRLLDRAAPRHHVLASCAGEKALAPDEQRLARVGAQPRTQVRKGVEAVNHDVVFLDARNRRNHFDSLAAREGSARVVHLRLPGEVLVLSTRPHPPGEDHGCGDGAGVRRCLAHCSAPRNDMKPQWTLWRRPFMRLAFTRRDRSTLRRHQLSPRL